MSVSKLRSVPVVLYAMAFPVLTVLVLREYGYLGAAAFILGSLLVLVLYQHYWVPLVVQSRLTNQ